MRSVGSDLPVWARAAAPKVPDTQRTTPVDDTSARLTGILSRVPITRVSDITPLDPIGLPTFAAVTPLAADLTTHMGKGSDAASARVSALMEAIERVSAEASSAEGRQSTYADLRLAATIDVVDPASFVLPDDTSYRVDRPISWVRADDLLLGSQVWMPRDLVVNPPTEDVLRDIDTNGLASGNTLMEAAVHGICEVIERDAWSQYEFCVEFGRDDEDAPDPRRIDLGSLPDELSGWVDEIRGQGFGIVVHDITSDIAVPTIRVVITDDHFPTPSGPRRMQFQGLGTHPSAFTAAARAVTEAVQGRMAVVHGARDDYNSIPLSRRTSSARARAALLEPGADLEFGDLMSVSNTDLRDDLALLLERVDDVGVPRVLVADLTRPDLSVPVVRVRIPGLSCFVVNRRRVDWRCLRHLL